VKIVYSDAAVKQLRKLSTGDKKAVQRIITAIEQLTRDPHSSPHVKKLKGVQGDRYRLRVGDYRVLYYIDDDTIKVSLVKHRQEAYDD
jgi:mRNA interferase RelE/StbE